jgi:hypothetical protein
MNDEQNRRYRYWSHKLLILALQDGVGHVHEESRSTIIQADHEAVCCGDPVVCHLCVSDPHKTPPNPQATRTNVKKFSIGSIVVIVDC